MAKKPVIKTWKDINTGGILEAGTSEHFHTGDWRSKVPIWIEDKCIHCMTCWAFCPDDSIKVVKGKNEKTGKEETQRGEYNYDFCKGCGICVEECLVNIKVMKKLMKDNPDLKLKLWDAHGNEEFDKGAACVMVSIKEAKEKHNIK